MMRRMTAVVLLICLLVLSTPFPYCAKAEENRRYTVLILDTSGSMAGTPLTVQKEAATKFCDTLLDSKSDSQVAIVTLNSSSSLALDFTNDLSAATATINRLTANGGTNITQALQAADQALSGVSSAPGSVCNVVLCSDGLPESGATSSDGPYSSSDYSDYRYANAVYNTAANLKMRYNVYTLGFFHKLTGCTLEFGTRLMSDIQNKGSFTVTDADDLVFVFEDIADKITQSQLREMYVDQHIAYYRSGFRSEVETIALPDSLAYDSTNNMLGNIVLDAVESGSYTGYMAARIITDSLNMNFNYINGSTSTYELLLADLITSNYYAGNVKEVARTNMMNDLSTVLGKIIDKGADGFEKIAGIKDADAEVFAMDWRQLNRLLNQMNAADDPQGYAEIYGQATQLLDKYLTTSKQKKWLEGLAKGKHYVAPAVSMTFNTVSDVLTYYASYEAYCTATETLKQTLVQIALYADSYVNIGGVDQKWYSGSLIAATNSFLANANPDATRADAVARRIAAMMGKNALSAVGDEILDVVIEQIPILRELHTVRKTVGVIASGAMLLVDVGTNIDDISYSASMIYHLYHLINCAALAADDFGSHIATAQDSFAMACRFDEAVRLYRSASLMMCDFGIQFEQLRLQEARRIINRLFPLEYGPLSPIYDNIAMKQASWYSTAIAIAAFEKTRIADIHCHDVNLSYNTGNRAVDLRSGAKVIVIACPVDVTVFDEGGTQRAALSNRVESVSGGYSPYFRVLETERGSGDYMKICVVPKNWDVVFTGTDAGKMFALTADITGGTISQTAVSERIPVYEGLEGHISTPGEDEVIVIDRDPGRELSIRLDKSSYVCNLGDTLQVNVTVVCPEDYGAGDHKYIGYFAYLNKGSWEQVAAWYIDGGIITYPIKMTIKTWEKLGSNLFVASIFPVNNFTTGASLMDHLFTVYMVDSTDNALVLPAGTRTVEVSAFEGASARRIILPDGTYAIQSRAFADMESLQRIDIPASVQFIADDAFEGSSNVLIVCPPVSYALGWAEENGMPCHPED